MAIYARGMDVAAVESAAQSLRVHRQDLRVIELTVDRAVAVIRANWDGEDMREFCNTLVARVNRAFDHCGHDLERLSAVLADNAQRQRDASR